ncbi:5-methyltetrahydropteroyltriglutamate--homocysteine S-methyltransferase [Pseudoclavibacter sp. CFCC 14310]|uniref:5-methyltetrahydropteroyltriglutamate-- homocysteine S-methyltransferase n=1 Tax=Pseudoclavibacter sp. CFCC 14310 TaxID=2615180 RepID=UPI001300D510|nr:5-methyltetrahydropteroyltriglutamate--homocysteine S-methyltransferase [Pseudoclavibacter sp. CFCC 14310]KAB1645600.1 5-methyltetrahydropteroyltriglutamate--homocysteine S-methyltransferase [Pseudoclavibacter sp. CFCC 14310]KAB1645941.1 5-methyltetrahydropteroyltriglutamate--homocysteine S-methyltransferase [Pseudoclavibacter sp. CFCC 14310]
MTTSHSIPFRADQVGSLLRPPAVHEARDRFARGEIDAAALRAVEDEQIARVIAKQEEVGLQAVTDGEFRRAFWHFDFFGGLNGVEIVEEDSGMAFHGTAPKPHAVHITGKVSFPDDHPMLEHFRFVRDHTTVTAKQCIPAPTVMHFRLAPESIDHSVYPDRASLFADLAQTWRDAVRAFHAAGCRYLQFDDTAWAYLCSDLELERARERGLDTENIAQAYADLLNDIVRDRPEDMTITTHVCRGNFRSTWISSGGYEPVAPYLLGQVDYDGFFLEYDSDRAGGFEPLRFLPHDGRRVVLGLVTSKSGDLEPADAVRARIREAAEFAPLDQLALSPQCGFASTEEGNVLTEEQQWAKLREITKIADEVWGFPQDR